MHLRTWQLVACATFGLVLAGCSSRTEPAPEPKARDAARSFFEALGAQEWERAYEQLEPASQKACTQTQFATRAQRYCDQLGFELKSVGFRACDEKEDTAIAQVVLAGSATDKTRRYREALQLKRVEETWRVVLPPSFGAAKK